MLSLIHSYRTGGFEREGRTQLAIIDFFVDVVENLALASQRLNRYAKRTRLQ